MCGGYISGAGFDYQRTIDPWLSALIRKFGDVFSMSPIEPKNWALTL